MKIKKHNIYTTEELFVEYEDIDDLHHGTSELEQKGYSEVGCYIEDFQSHKDKPILIQTYKKTTHEVT